MFIRPSAILLSVAALAGVATAVPTALEARGDTGDSECDTGSIQCCNNTYDSTSSGLGGILGLLGLSTIEGLIGLGCSSITGISTGSGSSCTQQPVCCTGDEFSGIINLGCSPININL